MPDVPPHTPGYCAKTVDGESDCVAGTKGALGLHHSETLSLRVATHACLRKCDACARCRYITVSPRHADCSWYAECDTDALLREPDSYRTYDLTHGYERHGKLSFASDPYLARRSLPAARRGQADVQGTLEDGVDLSILVQYWGGCCRPRPAAPSKSLRR